MMALARRKRVALAILGIVAVAVVIGWRVFRVGDLATIGSGYAAEQTCACMFVAGRTFESCMTDLEPLARKLIRVKPGTAEVTASGFAGVGTTTARYEKGFGCSLQN
jgi:hypothetical protein